MSTRQGDLRTRRLRDTVANLVSPPSSILIIDGSATFDTPVVFANANAGNIVVDLPSAIGNAGKEISVFKTDTSENTVEIVGFDGQEIAGNSSFGLVDRSNLVVVSNGIDWEAKSVFTLGLSNEETIQENALIRDLLEEIIMENKRTAFLLEHMSDEEIHCCDLEN